MTWREIQLTPSEVIILHFADQILTAVRHDQVVVSLSLISVWYEITTSHTVTSTYVCVLSFHGLTLMPPTSSTGVAGIVLQAQSQ